MRLQKYMAMAGVASRRKSEELISQGKVKVNGKVITEMGFDVDEFSDDVSVSNQLIEIERRQVYILLNKPTGYITSAKDQFGRKTVLDLVASINERVYPVGRLDYDTSGLLLLTNDGELTNKLTHPKHDVSKTYLAKVKGVPTAEELQKFEKGIVIDGKPTKAATIAIAKIFQKNALLEITITEGRNRQVRKMCEAIGHDVITLQRTKIGKIELDAELALGKWRYLTKKEVEYLLAL